MLNKSRKAREGLLIILFSHNDSEACPVSFQPDAFASAIK